MSEAIVITVTFFTAHFLYISFLYWYDGQKEPEWSVYHSEMFKYDGEQAKWLF